MPWKIIIAVGLITSVLVAFKIHSGRIELLSLERDLVQQNLDTERSKTRALARELAGQYEVVVQQQNQIRRISAAHDRAAARLSTLENQNAHANRQLKELKKQNADLAAWAAGAVPVAAADWLRNLSAGADHHHPGGADQPAAATRITDTANTNSTATQPTVDP